MLISTTALSMRQIIPTPFVPFLARAIFAVPAVMITLTANGWHSAVLLKKRAKTMATRVHQTKFLSQS